MRCAAKMFRCHSILCAAAAACAIAFPSCAPSADAGDDEAVGAAPADDDTSQDAAPPDQPAPSGYQPAYTLAIEVMESAPPQYAVNWTARVNTGGWRLINDEVTVEDSTAIVYVTLERPGEDEFVTQAFETLSGRYHVGTQVIDHVELHVRRTRRGENDDDVGYVLVKSTSSSP